MENTYKFYSNSANRGAPEKKTPYDYNSKVRQALILRVSKLELQTKTFLK